MLHSLFRICVPCALMVAWCGSTAWAAPINLATSGVATASSELGACCGSGTPFFASRAIDGSRSGASNTAIFHTSDPDLSAFLEVNLGSNRFLDRVQIFPRTNANQNSVENFRLDVFNASGANVYTKNYLTSFNTGDLPWGTSEVRNVQGSRVRISRLDGSPSFMTLGELEVWGQSTAIAPNVALGKTITSNDVPGFGTTNNDGIDGDISGHYSATDSTGVGSTHPIYHSANPASGTFWQLDLGSMQPLDYVNLYSRVDGATTGSVTLSILANDGVTPVFTQVTSLTGSDLSGQRFDQVFDFSNRLGRFLRLTTNGNEFLAFGELEVFGAPLTSLPEPASYASFGIVGLIASWFGWKRYRLARVRA